MDVDDNPDVKEKLVKFRGSIQKIDDMLMTLLNSNIYQKLDLKEKIDHDLFLGYTLNTLYWLYLRSKNIDPNDIKFQFTRIKQYMLKAKEAHERQTIRPRLDKAAASRFIKHGVSVKRNRDDSPTPNKKIKFE